jgi:cell division protein FtsB
VTPRAKKSTSVRTRVKDLTGSLLLPAASEHRLDRRPATRLAVRVVLASVVMAGATSLFVFPLRDYVTQRSALAQKNAEFSALADTNEQLQTEVNHLGTPEGIRNAARAQLGYVLPGEQRFTLVPMPALPTDLPTAWPYSLITDIVRVRAANSTTVDGALTPLAP